MAEQKSEKKAFPTKRPSALKRGLQSKKRKLINRSHKSTVLTAIRSITTSLENKEGAEMTQEKLNTLYSLMDKGVKKGIFKANKAARTKARLASRVKPA